MKILGKKPSEIRKAIAAATSALVVLLVALPIAGLPIVVAGAVAGVTAVLVAVTTFVSKPNVAAVIDSADNL